MEDEVVLLDTWPSMFGMRVTIALAEKGVNYEHKEQDLWNKSSLLLQVNPIHKKVPVLIHNGRAICESAIIVQYIDEVWNDNFPIMPSDRYERAQARFWVDFIDQKYNNTWMKLWLSEGEEHEICKEELISNLKQLEDILETEHFMGVTLLGFLIFVSSHFIAGFIPLKIMAISKWKQSALN